MSTAYTAFIENGEITNGTDFLKLCIRNFGIASNLRDEPLSTPVPTNFKPDPHYKQEYRKAVEENNKVNQMTFEEMKKELIESRRRELEFTKRYYRRCVENNQKYLKIKEEILNWIPPTKDHENLKKFALEQLDGCIKSGRDLQRYENNATINISKLNWTDEEIQEKLEDKKDFCKENVKVAYQRWQEAIKDTEMKNLWMKQFLDSLETIGDETSVSERGV